MNKKWLAVSGWWLVVGALTASAEVTYGPGGGVVTNTGRFVVSEATTYTGYTNVYTYSGNDLGSIDANLTLQNKTYLRLVGAKDSSTTRNLYIATNANADLTINITGNSAFYGVYRDSGNWSGIGLDPTTKTTWNSYIRMRVGKNGGAKDTTGRAQIVADSLPSFGGYGKLSMWAEYFYIESSAKAHDTGYIDFLKLDGTSLVDLARIYQNNTYHPARILFNGGAIRNNQAVGDSKTLPFQPAQGAELVLQSMNGNAIKIDRNSSQFPRAINGGMGTLRFEGDGEVIISEGQQLLPGLSSANCYPAYVDTSKGPVVWNQKGAIVLADYSILEMVADNQLPTDTCLRMRGPSATSTKCRPILDVNGYTVSLRSLISENPYSMVTNVMAKTKTSVESLIVFGTNDTDGVFCAKCYDHVNIEKVGAGTLVVSNATIDVNKTGTGKFTVKEGTVLLAGTNKIGATDIRESGDLTIEDGAEVIYEKVINVASGTTTDSTLYTDYANGVKLRIRKTGAGTLVFNNTANSFTGGIIVDGGVVDSKQAVDAVWNGSADTATGNKKNWDGLVSAPDFDKVYCYRPVFGTGGSEAVFPAGVSYLKGIRFTRNADFTVSGADDTTRLDLSAGITIAGTSHAYTIGVPVVQSVASTITLTSNTTVRFERGYKVTGNLAWNRNSNTIGAKLIFNGPAIASGTMQSAVSYIKGASSGWYPTVVFGATGNKASSLGFGYTHVQFTVDNAFDNTPFTVRGGTQNESTVKFNGTRQQTPTITCTNGKGYFIGNYPATLAVTNGWADRTKAVDNRFWPSAFTGWLKFEKSGEGYHVLGQANGASACKLASYGDLEVSGGTLELTPNATWLNGTNIIVKGTGKLILADPAKAQIGSQAVFHFGAGDASSQLVVTNGLTYQVEAIYLGDTQLPAGVYDGSSDEQLSGRITGGGKLRVKHGTMFIFR